jgi:formylglycine-generating enzyme required for sulfatase activity
MEKVFQLRQPLRIARRSGFVRALGVLLPWVLALDTSAFAQPTVSNVRAAQRTGTRFVDITYDLAHSAGLLSTVRVEVSQDGGITYGTASSLAGAVGGGIAPGVAKTVAWNAGQDWTAAVFNNVRVRVTADDGLSWPVPADMVLIPAGPFVMGDTFGEGDVLERPTRTVTVSAFYIARAKVQWKEWKEVREWAVNHGYAALADVGDGKAETHPVYNVSWSDAMGWLNAKSEKEGLTPVYYTDDALTTVYRTGSVSARQVAARWTANGYRLPTEAEWEKAARGGLVGRRFPWGDAISHEQANYNSSALYSYDISPTRGYHPSFPGPWPSTSPVGSFAANGYGLFDMAGNLHDWCWDWYAPYSGTSDPHGGTGIYPVVRGGSWGNGAEDCRVAARNRYTMGTRSPNVGFRAVRNLGP